MADSDESQSLRTSDLEHEEVADDSYIHGLLRIIHIFNY